MNSCEDIKMVSFLHKFVYLLYLILTRHTIERNYLKNKIIKNPNENQMIPVLSTLSYTYIQTYVLYNIHIIHTMIPHISYK